jgi:membrane protein DedA with SNARE-associated domain
MEDAIVNIQNIITFLSQFPYVLLILIAFSLTLIENIFPPTPSDICFVVITVLIGANGQLIFPAVIAAGVGGTTGFWIVYLLGAKFEKKIIEGGKFKFISRKSIEKTEQAFQKWGMKIVAINRFMSGTRAIISFFAGMSALPRTKALLYAGISSLAYYGLLAFAGYYFGKDWQRLLEFLHLYEKAAFLIAVSIIIVALSIWLVRTFRQRRRCAT